MSSHSGNLGDDYIPPPPGPATKGSIYSMAMNTAGNLLAAGSTEHIVSGGLCCEVGCGVCCVVKYGVIMFILIGGLGCTPQNVTIALLLLLPLKV